MCIETSKFPKHLPIPTRLHRSDGLGYLSGMWHQLRPMLDAEHQNGYFSTTEILLVAEALVAGDHQVEAIRLRRSKELTIRELRPSHVGTMPDFMNRKMLPQRVRGAVVEKNSHAAFKADGAARKSLRGLPSSCPTNASTSRHCCFVTGGYQSQKSSSETPSARFSNRKRIGRRVWVKHNCPPRRAGSLQTVLHSDQSISFMP